MIVASQSMGIVQHFPQLDDKANPRNIGILEIDKSQPWAFFDGTAQGFPSRCRGGGYLFITEGTFYNFRANLGEG